MKNETTEKIFNRWQWRTIICSMIAYAIFYFVRKNFNFAIPQLSAEYGITKTSFGLIMTIVGIIYGFSRFLNGRIADGTNARWHLSLALLGCTIVNFVFGFGAKISTMITGNAAGPDFVSWMVLIFTVLMILNNIFQGGGFPPCQRLMSHWVAPAELATKQSIWNLSHSIGAGLLSILCGWILATMGTDMSGNSEVVSRIATNLGESFDSPRVIAAAQHIGSWQWCFWIPAFIALAGVIFIIITLRDTPKSVGLPELEGTKTELDDKEDDPVARKKYIAKMVYKNPIIWMIALANFFVYIVRFGILDWGPTFLQESRGMSPVYSGFTVAAFEIAGLIGMLAAGFVTDRVFKGRGQRTCALCMIGSAAAVIAFLLMPVEYAQSHPYLVIITLAVAGFFIYGPQAMLGILTAQQATKHAAATANGIVGIMGYLATAVTGVGIGMLVDKFGWNSVFVVIFSSAAICAIILFSLWKLKRDAYQD